MSKGKSDPMGSGAGHGGGRLFRSSRFGRGLIGGVWIFLLGGTLGCAVGNDEAHWRGTIPARYALDVQGGTVQLTDITYDKGKHGAIGLRVGDVLLAVDGADVTNLSKRQIDALLLGPVGSDINLTVLRGGETKQIVVERRPKRGGRDGRNEE